MASDGMSSVGLAQRLAAGGQKDLDVLAVGHDSIGRAAACQVFCAGQWRRLGMSFGQWSGSGRRRSEARLFGWDGWRVSPLSSGDGRGLDSGRQGTQRTGHFPWRW